MKKCLKYHIFRQSWFHDTFLKKKKNPEFQAAFTVQNGAKGMTVKALLERGLVETKNLEGRPCGSGWYGHIMFYPIWQLVMMNVFVIPNLKIHNILSKSQKLWINHTNPQCCWAPKGAQTLIQRESLPC